jgi:Tol biopolymer transport system component
VVGKAQQPFWIIYWQGNEIWRIDDQGQDRQLLLDTYKSLGQWLTAHPMSGSDCCWNGPRVTVSPNGQQLAIVVVDKDKLTYQDEPFAFSIYLFDIKTQTLKFLSQGASPVWSPDGKRIAFARLIPSGQVTDGSLWIVDVDNGQINALVESDKANPQTRVSLWGWSPDSSQIAYRYNDGMVEKSEVWIKKADNSLSSSFQVPNINENFFTYGFSWMPDGQHILCFVEDYKTPEQPVNMWEVSVITGERKQLTQNLSVAGGRWSPNGKWLAINAVSLYEHQERLYSVWLASADGNQLSRITPTPPQDLIVGWSPDGTRLVLLREGSGMIILSLIDGDIIDLDANLSDKSIAGYSIGALK